MTTYYNEFDKKAAAWLRELIAQGHIPPGDVDERSITDVKPNELVGYRQLHFFAGVGGWAIAARLAGWPDDRELVTGSCPCQPFSVAGKGAGTADARHLWPDFFRIIRARRPAVVMGEQVAAAIGKNWFAGVRTDMESIGYAGRGIVVPACAVGAPHRRDRLWFAYGRSIVGYGHGQGLEKRERIAGVRRIEGGASTRQDAADPGPVDCGALEFPQSNGRREGRPESGVWSGRAAATGSSVSGGELVYPDSSGREQLGEVHSGEWVDGEREPTDRAAGGAGAFGNVAVTDLAERRADMAQGDHAGRYEAGRQEIAGHAKQRGHGFVANTNGGNASPERVQRSGKHRLQPQDDGIGQWDNARWLICHDGKARRVEPSIPLLVAGLQHRAPLLRGYGNAIVPAVAAEMMAAWMEEFPQ